MVWSSQRRITDVQKILKIINEEGLVLTGAKKMWELGFFLFYGVWVVLDEKQKKSTLSKKNLSWF